jgi:hypothetical protein
MHDTIPKIVDGPLMLILGVATSTVSILPIEIGNTSMIGKLGSIALGI